MSPVIKDFLEYVRDVCRDGNEGHVRDLAAGLAALLKGVESAYLWHTRNDESGPSEHLMIADRALKRAEAILEGV